jgi:hypothetical protein
MAENDMGRYCSKCSKTVVDFTQMNDREIINILENSGGRICGRLSDQQANRTIKAERQSHRGINKVLAGILLIGGILERSAAFGQSIRTTEVVANTGGKASGAVPTRPERQVTGASVENSIDGFVLDNTKEGIPAVSIRIKGTNAGTITDMDGHFKLIIPDRLLSGQITLQFQSIGFKLVERVVEQGAFPKSMECVLSADDSAIVGAMVISKVKRWWQFWK